MTRCPVGGTQERQVCGADPHAADVEMKPGWGCAPSLAKGEYMNSLDCRGLALRGCRFIKPYQIEGKAMCGRFTSSTGQQIRTLKTAQLGSTIAFTPATSPIERYNIAPPTTPRCNCLHLIEDGAAQSAVPWGRMPATGPGQARRRRLRSREIWKRPHQKLLVDRLEEWRCPGTAGRLV